MKRLFCLLTLLPALALAQQKFQPDFYLSSFISSNRLNDQPVQLFVRADENRLHIFLEEHGGHMKYRFGNYFAISVPASALESLAQLNGLTDIDLSLQHPVALNDTMRVRNRVTQVQTGMAPLPRGYTGKNVIVAFIDTGIDFNHADFKDSSGKTRVLRYWDQTQPVAPGFTPAPYGYGQVFDSAYINSGSCPAGDATGHGSTVVGTAAGNGLSTGTHWGVAPDAWIVMVESDFTSPNWLGTVADAVDYIYKLADSLGMPCVINASIGDYYGSHDGLDIPAQFMDSLVKAKRGRLFVSAAGNSGELGNYHLRYNVVSSDTSFTWFKYHPYNSSSAFPYGVVYFETWADSADMANISFSMGADQVSPVYKYRGKSKWRTVTEMLNNTLTDTIFSPAGNIIGLVDYYSEYSFGRYNLQVHMMQPDSNSYYFRFSTTGTGVFDAWSAAWLGISDMVYTGLPTVGQYADMVHYKIPDSSKITVSSFTCMPSTITVANYNNIQDYNSLQGPVSLGGIENDIAPSSSRGPTRDNRIKPEISATGNVTFSPGPLAICSLYVASYPDRILPDSLHMRNGGTSMAAPVVAGIGALMLERCPSLSWNEFIDAIVNTAYTDSYTGAVPNMSFGFGKTHAFGAMQQTLFSTSVTGTPGYCPGDSALLTASCTCNSYTWNTGDTSSAVYFSMAGPAWVVAKNAAECPGDTVHISVTAFSLPDTNVTLNNYILTSSTSGLTYQWYLDGNPVSGATQNTYSVPFGMWGYYSLEITDTNGCSATSALHYVQLESVDELSALNLFVYPNPASHEIHVLNPKQERLRFDILNLQGQVVATLRSAEATVHIPVENLAVGEYVLRVQSSDHSGFQKISLMR